MKKRRMFIVMVLNLTIVGFEIGFGIFSRSMGLVADALHNLSDVAAILVAYLAIVFSEKKASSKMTFGYLRAEMMAGFINSFVLVGAMGFVVFESIQRLLHPMEVEGSIMMIVAGVALVANVISLIILRDMHVHGLGESSGHSHHDHDHKEKPSGNINVRAAMLHMLSDVGISAAVIVGGLLVFVGKWYWLDSVLSLTFSIYIIYEALKILLTAFTSLMDASNVSEKILQEILETITNFNQVKSIHDVHITQPSSTDRHFSAHIVLEKVLPLDEIDALILEIKGQLKNFNITHCVLQPESIEYHKEEILCQEH